jgi:hypothetical protein
MCTSCRDLYAKLVRAQQAGDTQRAAVMKSLYENRVKQCTERKNTILAPADVVAWKNGETWRVGRVSKEEKERKG